VGLICRPLDHVMSMFVGMCSGPQAGSPPKVLESVPSGDHSLNLFVTPPQLLWKTVHIYISPTGVL